MTRQFEQYSAYDHVPTTTTAGTMADNRTTELTAKDRLRAMLDERGVRWIEATPSKTKWYSPVLNGPVAVSEWNGKLVLDAGYVNVTPEQAIAATLGSGTCEMEPSFIEPSRLDFMQEYLCSECGEYAYLQIATDDDRLNYCPNCGRKVVSA